MRRSSILIGLVALLAALAGCSSEGDDWNGAGGTAGTGGSGGTGGAGGDPCSEGSPWPGEVIDAASCDLEDVQAAVDAAADGDRVHVPACEATWSATLDVSKSIVLQGAGLSPSLAGLRVSRGPVWQRARRRVEASAGPVA